MKELETINAGTKTIRIFSENHDTLFSAAVYIPNNIGGEMVWLYSPTYKTFKSVQNWVSKKRAAHSF